MNDLIKKLLTLSGWYFTPDSVINKLRREKDNQTCIMKMGPPLANPPFTFNEKRHEDNKRKSA